MKRGRSMPRKAMKAKEYLEQVILLNEKIHQKQLQYNELLQTAVSIGAIRYDKEKVQASTSSDKIDNTVSRYMDLQNEINQDINRFIALRNKIIDEIQKLSNVKFVKILFMRYIQNKKLEEIAVELNYSYQYVRKLHGYALNSFTKMHPELFGEKK